MKNISVYPEHGHTLVAVIRRKSGITLEEFHAHYEHIHAPLASQLPGLLSYRQHPTRPPGQGDGPYLPSELPYDAVSIFIFENAAAAEAAWISPEGQRLDEDTLTFIDTQDQLIIPVIPRQIV
ncbi:EthD domain-containing protein [Paenibacillus sp. WLX1005]|uniref:EthD domain-containing protein n=1 Tax=Paenibacillus sp. WLX1005 TaxID=3243766 RepID=UPI003983E268